MIEIVSRIGDTVVDIVDGPCRAHDGTPLVRPGFVEVGVVTYEIRQTTPAREHVPRRRMDARPFVYIGASLIVQLAIWLIAVTTEPFEKLERPKHRIARITHVRVPDPPPKPEPAKPEPSETHEKPRPAVETSHTAVHKRAAKHEETTADALPGNPAAAEAVAIAHLGKTFDDIDVKGMLAKTDGPLVTADTEDPNAFGGGGGHHFNADAVAPEQTYAVQRWALPTFVRTHKGELAPVPTIEWCDEDSCLTRGSLPIEKVLAILARHDKQIAQCYREHTGDLVGNVRVRFPVGADGKVTGVLGTEHGPVGYGTGTVGRCIAKIAQGIRWPQADDETYVFIGLAFRPAAG